MRSKRIGYLCTAYPSVSHTFIRREIVALESSGLSIQRYAIRSGGEIVERQDRLEQERTTHLLSQSKLWLIAQAIRGLAAANLRLFHGAKIALQLNRKSDRGIIRHIAYLVEALVVVALSRRDKLGHLHVHFGTNAAAVALIASKLGGPAYSLTIHGPDEFDAPIGLSIDIKVINAVFVVAISDYCAAQLRRWVPIDYWHKINVVRCSIEDIWFDDYEPSNTSNDEFLLVSVGRLSPQKDQLTLLMSFRDALEKGARIKLVIIGDGELREVLEEKLEKLGLTQKVEIFGWADSAGIREMLRAANVFVLPSSAEGLPIVLMEAMAMGRPVISTHVAAIPELVEHREHGWLVPAGQRAALATAMLEASQSSNETLVTLGLAARAAVRRRHAGSTEIEKLHTLFRNCTLSGESSSGDL